MARFFLSDDPQARHSESSAHSSRDADGPVSESRRQETSPPALFFRNQPAWRRWVSAAWQWLWDLEDDPGLEPALSPMNQVRVEFRNALWDLQSAHADHVRDQIEKRARCANCGTCVPMCSKPWRCTEGRSRLNCASITWTTTSRCVHSSNLTAVTPTSPHGDVPCRHKAGRRCTMGG
jgi:hypothetical protein